MGGSNSREEIEVNQLFSQANPNIAEITKRLPNNKELRVKKIYHVNKPDIEPPPMPEPPLIREATPVPMVITPPKPQIVYRVPVAAQQIEVPQQQVVYVQNPQPRVVVTPVRTESQLKVIRPYSINGPNVVDFAYNKGIVQAPVVLPSNGVRTVRLSRQ